MGSNQNCFHKISTFKESDIRVLHFLFSFVGFQVDWTSELHKKFVQAVEKLGVDQAIPSRILDLMKVEGLTRHNIASHLQVGGKCVVCHCKALFFD